MSILLALAGTDFGMAANPADDQKHSPTIETASRVIKTESNEVLIDVVVTDKKGNYIKDLEKKDFHVFEDDAEQPIAFFSREADVAPRNPEGQHYIVLFFADSTMNSTVQVSARQLAGKFLESLAYSNYQIAVAVFGGSLKVIQNFTADRQLLKRAVSSVKNSSVNPNATGASGEVAGSGEMFLGESHSSSIRLSPLLAIRDVARSLSRIPGRKTLILFSGGIALASERRSELTIAIDALNKSNIAAYPVDVRGVGLTHSAGTAAENQQGPETNPARDWEYSVYRNTPDTHSSNEAVLPALATATGGFEIFNTNDPVQGLQKVAQESDGYYNLAYVVPRPVHDGNYHKVKVNVDRPGVVVRSRPGYFDFKDPDLLKGSPEGKTLEEHVASQEVGNIPVSLSAPYFYLEPGVARVNLALSVPGSAIDLKRRDGAFQSEVSVLGIAYRENGTVAARFSDKVKLNYEKRAVKDFVKGSFDYANTFKIAPGSYMLKVVLSTGGEKFGKYVTPLLVEPFSGDKISVGGPALGERYVPASQEIVKMDTALIENRTALVFQGNVLVPSTSYRFAKGLQPVVYLEVYDPLLKNKGEYRVGVEFSVMDRKNNQQVFSSNGVLINENLQPGNPLVPMGFRLPIDQLPAGDYRFEVKGRDSMGNISSMRTAEFSIQ